MNKMERALKCVAGLQFEQRFLQSYIIALEDLLRSDDLPEDEVELTQKDLENSKERLQRIDAELEKLETESTL